METRLHLSIINFAISNCGFRGNYVNAIEADDDRTHSIKTTDLTMPPNVGPLISYLRQKAIKAGPR